ncbi:MFS transporter [Peribacillus sp. SCS-155]|uniref:MFS transporter n=1 Tax=Peribacillus sedimenti TaxID=3115297 RepID=UPI0039062500
MKNKSFTFLWTGQAAANCADILYTVALVSIVYSQSGSAMVVAMIPFVVTAAKFVSGLLAPILVDKYRLKALLAHSQLGKTFLLGILFVMVVWNSSHLSNYLIFTLVCFISFLDGWAAPARNAMLPRLVQREELVKANSLVSIADQTTQLGSWAVGGILVASINEGNVLLISLFLYLAATVCMYLIHDPMELETSTGDSQPKWEAVKEGWILIWTRSSLRSLHTIFTIEYIANAVWIAAILYIYVQEVLHMDKTWWGYINSSYFLGLIAGGFIGMKNSSWIDTKLSNVIIISSFGISAMTLAFGLISTPWLALAICAIYGVMEQLKIISMQTALQKSVTVQQLPKVYSAQSALISVVFGLSSLMFGYITDLFNVRFSFLIAAGLLCASALFAMANRNRFAKIETETQ